jgi:hypothetical protein
MSSTPGKEEELTAVITLGDGDVLMVGGNNERVTGGLDETVFVMADTRLGVIFSSIFFFSSSILCRNSKADCFRANILASLGLVEGGDVRIGDLTWSGSCK